MRFIFLLISAIFLSGCANSWYLGEWRVSDVEFPAISALGYDEAETWFGSQAIYSEAQVSFRGTTCQRPEYELREVAEQEFRTAYRASFSQLGIDGDTAEVLSVTCSEVTSFPGMTLIKIAGDVVYLPWDGAFFRLARSASEPRN